MFNSGQTEVNIRLHHSLWWNDNSPITIASHAVGKGREKRRANKAAKENSKVVFKNASYLLPIQRNYHPPYPSPLRSSVDERPLHEFSLGTGRETLDVD
ncbi:hypothetical protein P5673_022863 [Acropora cervicornis]|uniref:Uncharacterized protein n=1 Tax=Acropora cervicornis TaxID=6130 RepID=A0AAD9Q668_ACRCE|nr:hypothetical protein P5673_022863 [Acropora cervicornis]